MIHLALAASTSTTANIVAACGAIATLITALSLLIPTLRRVKATEAKVETVHTIVNQKYTDQQRYIIALSQQVLELGGKPLVDQSQPVPGVADAQPGQPTDP